MANYIIFPDNLKIQVAITSLTPSYTSEKTKHKIENGSDITDHFVKNNITIRLDGVVSEIDNELSFSEKINIIDNYINKGILPTKKDAHESVKIADSLFLTAWENGDLITIQTSNKTYKNMSIIGYETPRIAKNGKSLVFSLNLEETRYAITKSEKLKYSQTNKSKKDDSLSNDDNKKILEKLKKKYQDRVSKGNKQKEKLLPKKTMKAKVLIQGVGSSVEDLL